MSKPTLRDCSQPFPVPTISLPAGRVTVSGCISLHDAERVRFRYGRYRRATDIQFKSPKQAELPRPSRKTEDTSTTPSMSRMEYGECRCRADQKFESTISPPAQSGSTGDWLTRAFIT